LQTTGAVTENEREVNDVLKPMVRVEDEPWMTEEVHVGRNSYNSYAPA